MLSRLLRSCAAVAAVISATGSSAAAYHNYHGVMCRQLNAWYEYPSGVAWHSPRESVLVDGMYNTDIENTESFVCPIERDMSTFSTGAMTGAIWLRNYNCTTSDPPMECSSYALTPGGSLLVGSTANYGANGVNTLALNGPTTSYTFAYRFFYCGVRRKCTNSTADVSGILAYRSMEQ